MPSQRDIDRQDARLLTPLLLMALVIAAGVLFYALARAICRAADRRWFRPIWDRQELAVLPAQRTGPRQQRGVDTMNAAKIMLALTLLAGAAATSFLTPTPSFAQSQPN
jgi:hypothetical protein